MYYLLYLGISLLAFCEIFNRNIHGRFFNLIFVVLIFVLICRYGQGQDYFNYQQLYQEIAYWANISPSLLIVRSDVGFSVLCYTFYLLKLPYIIFCGFIGILTMYWFYLFFVRYCEKTIFSLFIFYSVIYLVYPFSILRQGIVMAFFAGILLPLLEDRKYTKYFLYAFFASTIHLSALVMLAFPLIWSAKIKYKWAFALFVMCSIVLFSNIYLFSYIPISFINERVSYYISENQSANFLLAKLARFLLVFPIFIFPTKWLNEDSNLLRVRNMMLGGYIIYTLSSFSELAASRLWGYFLVFECLMLYRILCKNNCLKLKVCILVYYFFINVTLWFKDINGFIQQGDYQNCTIFTYPYVSVFNDKSTIYQYRTYFGTVDDIE